jgi:DNA polymerase/3'-5' exonuclease PolX
VRLWECLTRSITRTHLLATGTGNRNAGASYTKVIQALKDLPYEITEKNASGLAKGKTKVQNIGDASSKKILEFCKTGTMEKLEEKRAAAP